MLGISGAAEGLQDNPATNAMLNAVRQSFQMFSDIKILQWQEKRIPFSGLAGPVASGQSAQKGTAALWLLAAGLALSPVAPAAIIPAGIALSKMRK